MSHCFCCVICWTRPSPVQVQPRETSCGAVTDCGIDYADVSAFDAHHDPLQVLNRDKHMSGAVDIGEQALLQNMVLQRRLGLFQKLPDCGDLVGRQAKTVNRLEMSRFVDVNRMIVPAASTISAMSSGNQ